MPAPATPAKSKIDCYGFQKWLTVVKMGYWLLQTI